MTLFSLITKVEQEGCKFHNLRTSARLIVLWSQKSAKLAKITKRKPVAVNINHSAILYWFQQNFQNTHFFATVSTIEIDCKHLGQYWLSFRGTLRWSTRICKWIYLDKTSKLIICIFLGNITKGRWSAVSGAWVCLSLNFRPIEFNQIGCDKSCDIRIIDDIIVCCQQGQMIQQV